MPRYSWSKKKKKKKKKHWCSLRKLDKKNTIKFKDVIESYWSDVN